MAYSRREIRRSFNAARREARQLFGRLQANRVHKMPNGLFMPGFNHEDFLRATGQYQTPPPNTFDPAIAQQVQSMVGNRINNNDLNQATPAQRPQAEEVQQMSEELMRQELLDELQEEIEARVAAAEIVSQDEVYKMAMEIAQQALQVVYNRDMQN
jgi:hypothetical protein